MRRKIHQIIYLLGVSSLLWASSCASKYVAVRKDFSLTEMNNTIATDSSIVAFYWPYKKQLNQEMNRVIGVSDVQLTKERKAETLIGNFFTEALLYASTKINNPADIAFATKGGIRTELNKGNITIGNVFEIMPFENQLTILELSGQDILRLAGFIAETAGQPIAGMSLRIQDKKASNIRVQGQLIDPHKTYKVVTYDYLANGGDNIKVFDQAIKRIDYPLKVRESLIEYIEHFTKQGKHINIALDERIKTDE